MTDRNLIPNPAFLADEEDGQTMAEYGVVLGVIVLGIIVAIGLVNLAIEGRFLDVSSTIRDLSPL
jgi:Flp pilus assembly pilin Flp